MQENFAQLLKNIRNDIKVEIADEFDQNFERKAFFDTAWKAPRINNSRGTLMQRSGNGLRKSLYARVDGDNIRFYSTKPYASIHNEGGKIKVTAKMKRFFWAQFYSLQRISAYTRNDRVAEGAFNESEIWRKMALMPIGSHVTIPKRQFIGEHPIILKAMHNIIDNNVNNYLQNLMPTGSFNI